MYTPYPNINFQEYDSQDDIQSKLKNFQKEVEIWMDYVPMFNHNKRIFLDSGFVRWGDSKRLY